MSLSTKLKKLEKIILNCGSAVIAFSGGMDSSFLLYIASRVLPEGRVIAVTADSPIYPRQELAAAIKAAKSFKVRHIIIKTRELNDKCFSANPVNRCYYCKKSMFLRIRRLLRGLKVRYVFDASNITDKDDFRPGNRAKDELGVRSPLQEAGMTKPEIRSLSRLFKLHFYNKPAQACLASRIPYGRHIDRKVLYRVEKAEAFLAGEGFKDIRARDYGALCSIEIGGKDIPALILKRKRIVDKLKRIGYNYVTLDLEGYRRGSMNEVVRK